MPRIPTYLLVAASAWASRIAAAVLQLASVRILTEGLGIEQYAVFAILTSLMGWYLLVDLGLGVSLQNTISELRAKERPYHGILSTTALIGLGILGVALIVLHLTSARGGAVILQAFDGLNVIEKARLFEIAGVAYIASAIGGIGYKVFYAEHRGYLANILPAVSAMMGYAGIIWVNTSEVDDKLFLSLLAYLGPNAVMPMLALVWLSLPGLKSLGQSDWTYMSGLIKRAGRFWFFGLMAALVLQVDYLVMSQFLQAGDIASYNIATKVYGLVFFVFNAVLFALWPVFAESIARGDWEFVQRKVRVYAWVGLGYMAISTIALIFLMPYFMAVLSPREMVIIPVSVIVLLGIYQMLRVWTDIFSMVLQSANYLRPFWVSVPIQAALSVYLQIVLTPKYGIEGVVIGLIASFVLTVAWWLPLSFRKKMVTHRHPMDGLRK